MSSLVGLVVVLGIAGYLVAAYNSLVSLRNRVENAWRQIDVQLKRRHDLIPNLVEAVKGYMQFERETLNQVVEARGKAISAPDQASRMAAENQLTAGVGRLLAVMENYPQLKADENVLRLQEELTTTENQIAFSRQAYNDAVLQLNTRVETFPTNLIANNFGFKGADYFKAAPGDEALPKVDLSMGAPALALPPPRPDEGAEGSQAKACAANLDASASPNPMTPQRTDFWELERRNRRETVLLVAVFIALFAILGFGLDFVVGDVSIYGGRLTGFPFLTIVALLIATIQSFVSYYGGASLVLLSVHARELTPDTPQHQTILDVVREMALAARMPVPKAYIIDDPAPNAFATGRDPDHSVICVTQGLVEEMDREELQGVLGHEMAHIRDYDIRTMMMIAVLVGGIAMLADFLYRSMWFSGGGRRRSSSDSNGSGGGSGALIVVAVFILAALAPIFAQLLAMAVSRQREYLADAASVEFTRNPRALLRALQRIAATESPLAHASRGVAHLFIVNPLQGAKEDDEGFFANLLSTHPPLSRRIARLRALAGEASPAPEGRATGA